MSRTPFALAGAVVASRGMGERTQYTPGTFSWTDLNTTDQEAAKTFYGDLFGWEFNDMPAGEGVVYSMAALGGKYVAAISPQPQQQREAGVPPAWNSYITVEDADATAARAQGARRHRPRAAVRRHGGRTDGASSRTRRARWFLSGSPNSTSEPAWSTPPARCRGTSSGPLTWTARPQFYGELLGWTTAPMEGSDMPYLVIQTADGHSNGGIRPPMPPGTPPFWLVYFATADIDASLAKVSELGGNVLVGHHRHRDRQDRGRPGPAGRRVRALRRPPGRLTRRVTSSGQSSVCGMAEPA